jgi:hypothetical protein
MFNYEEMVGGADRRRDTPAFKEEYINMLGVYMPIRELTDTYTEASLSELSQSERNYGGNSLGNSSNRNAMSGPLSNDNSSPISRVVPDSSAPAETFRIVVESSDEEEEKKTSAATSSIIPSRFNTSDDNKSSSDEIEESSGDDADDRLDFKDRSNLRNSSRRST